MLAALATLAVAGWAAAQGTAALPTIYVEAMRIELAGKAGFAGNATLEFKAQGQEPKLVSVDVIPKMKADEIARDIYKQLTLAAGSAFKVKQSGERITIEKANKNSPTFSMRVTNQSVLGVSLLIDRD
jgi:hypothetical protein